MTDFDDDYQAQEEADSARRHRDHEEEDRLRTLEVERLEMEREQQDRRMLKQQLDKDPAADDLNRMGPIWEPELPGDEHNTPTNGDTPSIRSALPKVFGILLAVLLIGGAVYLMLRAENKPHAVNSVSTEQLSLIPDPEQTADRIRLPAASAPQPRQAQLADRIESLELKTASLEAGRNLPVSDLGKVLADQVELKSAVADLQIRVASLAEHLAGFDEHQAAQDQRLNDFGAWQAELNKQRALQARKTTALKVPTARQSNSGHSVATSYPLASAAAQPPFELLSVDSWNMTTYAAVREQGSSEIRFVAAGERFAGWQFDAISMSGQSAQINANGVRVTVVARR